MDKFREMIIFLLCLLISAKAQNIATQIDEIQSLHPSTEVVLIALAIMFCIIFAIIAYFRFCERLQPYTTDLEADRDGPTISKPRFSGLDTTIIESLPFFRFSSLKGSKEGLECAVCLSRFEGPEILRLLPKCSHVFHVDCIDRWLGAHSSCPLCRNRLNAGDIKSAALPNLEFFIQREERQGRSSRFYVQDSNLHKFKHKIIVSDVIDKRRWSDVNSSDMISLNSEMLNALSIKGLFAAEVSAKEQILKIKEDMERNQIVAKNGNNSGEISECDGSESLDPYQMRSMSEITTVSRFTELDTDSRRMEKEDKVSGLWLSIARRTINWFSVQGRSSDAGKTSLHV